jgi:hypothetical protein
MVLIPQAADMRQSLEVTEARANATRMQLPPDILSNPQACRRSPGCPWTQAGASP